MRAAIAKWLEDCYRIVRGDEENLPDEIRELGDVKQQTG